MPLIGALVAPETRDLQGIANRSFLHVAADHPEPGSGERYFLSMGLTGLWFSASSYFQSFADPSFLSQSPLPTDHSDTKIEYYLLPGNEPADFFASPLRVKKLTPAMPGRAEVIFPKIIVRTLVAPVQR